LSHLDAEQLTPPQTGIGVDRTIGRHQRLSAAISLSTWSWGVDRHLPGGNRGMVTRSTGFSTRARTY
jgi:hypothetical protein